jgi:hypothetical protein
MLHSSSLGPAASQPSAAATAKFANDPFFHSCPADMDGFKLLEIVGLELGLPVISECRCRCSWRRPKLNSLPAHAAQQASTQPASLTSHWCHHLLSLIHTNLCCAAVLLCCCAAVQ